MASIGQGVCKDASVPAVRLTYYSDAHADAQNDQANNFRYDLSKIWACMGRVGANGVMRDGFIERGNPYLGYAAASIEEFQGGVFLAEKWDTLLASTLSGVAGEMLYIGGNWPWDDALLHLAGVVVGPSAVAYEYWNGAAWTADTLSLTPDLSGATGLNQRLRCVRPTNWVKVASGLAGEVRYWRRIRQTGAGAVVTLNSRYKDFIQGHVRDFFCQYDLKKGDDGAGTNTSEFKDDSPHTLRFEEGRKHDSRTTVTTFVQVGSVSNLSRGRAMGKPWCWVSNAGHVVHPCKMYGGLIMGNPRAYAGTTGVALRGLGSEVVGVRIAGFHENTLGAVGTAALLVCQDVRVSIDRDASTTQRPLTNLSIDPSGVADKVVVDVHDVSTVAGVNSSIASGTFRGLRLTHDTPGGQLFRSGGSGPIELFDMDWGGPALKTVNGTPTTSWREWRYLLWHIWNGLTGQPLAGIPVRAWGSDTFKQLEGVTDANGQVFNLPNAISNAPVTGTQNRNIFLAESFDDPTGLTSKKLDEGMIIEINPKDHPNWNPAFETKRFPTRWTRRMVFDATTGTYGYQDWQRENVMEINESLGPPPNPAPPPPEYVTKDIAEVPYVPLPVTSVPYEAVVAPSVPYMSTAPPDSAYMPIEVPATVYKPSVDVASGALGWGIEWGIAWGGPSAGGAVGETEYTAAPIPSTDYDPVPVP